MQTDPIGYKDELNWYAYVGNNAIILTDPTGMIASASGSFENASLASVNVAAQSSAGGEKRGRLHRARSSSGLTCRKAASNERS